MSFPPAAFDLSLFRIINEQARSRFLDILMPAASLSELATIALAAALAVFLIRRKFRPAAYILWMMLALAAVDGGTHLVKDHFGRVRPLNSIPGAYYQEDGAWRRLPADFVRTKERGSSYFSAHATNSMCLAVMAMVFWRNLRPWLILAPLVVGYSRIYLGKHFPTDVLAGWTYGAVAGWGLALAFLFFEGRLASLRPALAVQKHPQAGRDQEQNHAEHDLDR